MALNLDNLFAAIGRAGRNAYLIASGQDLQKVPFGELYGFSYVNPAWIASLSQGYDGALRSSGGGMAQWIQSATTILLQLVAAENPAYGTSLPLALQFVYQEMVAQNEFVDECTIGAPAIVADAANVGSGSVFITTTRGDGLSLQNTIAEESVLLITADSFTGGATAGQEPWRWQGAPNVSSLGTGTGVGLWDFDWPMGSGGSCTGNCISASQDATTSGNYLTNGDCESWTGGTPALDYWNLVTGTWGTSIQRSSAQFLSGLYSIEFIAGTVNNELTQQFGTASTTTGTTAGTQAAVLPFATYAANFFAKAGGVISAGVLTVAFVDSTGTVINDQAGNPAAVTLALTGLSTSWTGYSFALRLPVQLPADGIVRLSLEITTDLAGANLFVDQICMATPKQMYPGGPAIQVFSNPADLYEARPDPDGYTITTSNDRAGSSYGATFQTLFYRLFQTPGLILPYDSSPTLLDTLITDA